MNASSEDRLSRISALKPARKHVAAEPRGYEPALPAGADDLQRLLGATLQETRHGRHLSVRRWFSDIATCDVTLSALRLLLPDATEEALDLNNWLFLDTETTGLAGGTGTYAFLVGIAWWDAGGLEVEQFFMRDHSEEHSVLAALKERLAERRILVTFNGKAFDWPLLETRFRMTRSISPRMPLAHLDLLHPSRQLWRIRIGSVRLSELERHVLGRNRGHDIVSSLIPQIYFDYLRGGCAEQIVPIFYHNQMDLAGLAALAGRVFSLLAAPESECQDALEVYGVSRICDRRGHSTRARDLYAHAIARELPKPTDASARAALARLAKREGDFARAASLWLEMRGMTREGLEAYVELAKYYEHRARRPEQAVQLLDEALAALRSARSVGTVSPERSGKYRIEFRKRLARLRNRCKSPNRPDLQANLTESPEFVSESK